LLTISIPAPDREELLAVAADSSHFSADWPSAGSIEFQNVSLTYRDGLEPALSGINLIISGQEHVGIVGRTGSGERNHQKNFIFCTVYREN
jgi:ABC-type multidrug transport system fused ATPase/permease subunit